MRIQHEQAPSWIYNYFSSTDNGNLFLHVAWLCRPPLFLLNHVNGVLELSYLAS